MFDLLLVEQCCYSELVLGRGFADIRKKNVVSKYRKEVVREKKNLGAWSEKLRKIYAETENTVDEDPLERFGVKKKKKKKRSGVNVSAEQEPCRKQMVTAVAQSDRVSSASSEARTSREKPSATSDNSRLVHLCSGFNWLLITVLIRSAWPF